MDYCRVDYNTGYYEYLENDTLTRLGEYRNHELMSTQYKYQRIKRIKELPTGKEIKTLYSKRRT